MSAQPFVKVELAWSRAETRELSLLQVAGGPASLYRAHAHPGQYAAVRLPEAERPGYLALASLPGEPHFEFLVRGGGRFADTLRGLHPGDTLEVSEPMGTGFPLERARGRDLWLVGVGSGIGALRPVVRMAARDRDGFGAVRLLFGARGGSHVPFEREMQAWREAGIEIHVAASRPAEGEAWEGHRGYVQDVLPEVAKRLDGAVMFACGMRDMLEAVRAASLRLGLDPGAFHLNT